MWHIAAWKPCFSRSGCICSCAIHIQKAIEYEWTRVFWRSTKNSSCPRNSIKCVCSCSAIRRRIYCRWRRRKAFACVFRAPRPYNGALVRRKNLREALQLRFTYNTWWCNNDRCCNTHMRHAVWWENALQKKFPALHASRAEQRGSCDRRTSSSARNLERERKRTGQDGIWRSGILAGGSLKNCWKLTITSNL